MKVYVASSWRNIYQPAVVSHLRELGAEVYDFRHPKPGYDGFRWTDVDPDYKHWTVERYRQLLDHPVAREGFNADMEGLVRADACVLVMPCGKSAHLELGWAIGMRKWTAILYPFDYEYPQGAEAKQMFKGHTLSEETSCDACQESTRSPTKFGCLLPGKLSREFEPELMAKMADVILTSKSELAAWAAEAKRQVG